METNLELWKTCGKLLYSVENFILMKSYGAYESYVILCLLCVLMILM